MECLSTALLPALGLAPAFIPPVFLSAVHFFSLAPCLEDARFGQKLFPGIRGTGTRDSGAATAS
jgi:hypothetical protein